VAATSPTQPTAQPSATGGGSGGNSSTTLQLGSTGPAVYTLQQDLRSLHIDPHLHPNGIYDQQTQADVTTFQTSAGVTADPPGVYGPATQAAMASALNNNNGGGNN
jgi:peptidoglycan hydrolase-like protein with peptidoglycan-binding domain